MKKVVILAILLFLFLSAVVYAVQQTYEVPWWTVDGGSEMSTGDGFALSGIIGQADAGPVMQAGEYVVTGGYWHGAEQPVPKSSMVYLPVVQR